MYNVIRRSDSRFIYYNGALLLLVSIIPFTTSLIANFIATDAMTLAGFVYMVLLAGICGVSLLNVVTRYKKLLPTETSRRRC